MPAQTMTANDATSALTAPPSRGVPLDSGTARNAVTQRLTLAAPAGSASRFFGPAILSATARALRGTGHAALRLPPSTWLLIDTAALTASWCMAYATFPPSAEALDAIVTPHVALWQAVILFSSAAFVASLILGLYERETLSSRSRILTRVGLTTVTATAAAYAVIYVILYATVSRRTAALAMGMYAAGAVLIRLGACWIAHTVPRGLLVVGPESVFRSFKEAKAGGLLSEYHLVGRTMPERVNEPVDNDCKYVEFLPPHNRHACPPGITDIVVSDAVARNPDAMKWLRPCLRRGCRVTNEAVFYEKEVGQILVDQITPSWFLFADLKVHCDEHMTLKRLVDCVLAGIGLVLSAPLWPLIALAVKISDRGPAFYAQQRVGQHGRVFKLYKFRTMRPDAENGRSLWCQPNDPRVTPIGRVLRKTRLDELPQLFNVLLGQMSLVGPRPERPDIVAELTDKLPYYAERHLVKPGITGWAQISFRYGSSVEDAKRKLQFDLYYLKHMSFELDMIILFRTAGTFLRGAC